MSKSLFKAFMTCKTLNYFLLYLQNILSISILEILKLLENTTLFLIHFMFKKTHLVIEIIKIF